MVLVNIVDQLRARRLVKIGYLASKQRELRVLKFRQIEREGGEYSTGSAGRR